MSTQDYEILLKIRADLQQALGGMSDMKAGLKGVGDQAKIVSDGLKGAAGSLFGFLSIGAAVAGLKEMFSSISEGAADFAKLHEQTGLSTDAIQAYNEAARETNVAQDAMSEGLKKLAVSIGKAQAGSQQALQPFKDLNINFAQFKDLTPDQQYQLVAERLTEIKAPADEARIGVQLFGRTFLDIKPAIEAAANEGLQPFLDKLKQLGVYMDGDFIAQLIAVKDRMGDIGLATKGVVTEFESGFLPAFQQGMDSIVQSTSGATNGFQQLGEFIGTVFKSVLLVVEDVGSAIGIIFANVTQQIQIRWEGTLTALKDDFSGFGNYVSQIAHGHLIDAFDTLKQTSAQVKKDLTDAHDRLEALPSVIKSIGAAWANNAANLFPGGPLPAAPKPPSLPKYIVPADAASGGAAGADGAKAMAAALAKLQDQLASLRTQGLDPTATAWAQYNKTVDEAVASAQKAGNTPEANAALNQIVVQAARIRDAALDKIAQQDRDAYEQLLKTISTQAEAKLQDAIAQIAQFNGMLIRGTISAQEYHDAIKKIGENIGMPSPEYRDPTQRHGGSDAYAQLASNVQAGRDLDQWKINEENRAKDLKNEEAYQARLAEIDQEYAQKRAVIESARQTLTLNATSEFFGNLASLSTSHNKKLAEIGKAAAIAQALINTYKNATIAYGDGLEAGGPYGVALGIAFAAAAVAAGLANVAAIESQSAGGYATGGYTGPGGKHEPAGVVHKGEIVWSQENIARFGGIAAVEAVRTGMLPSYAVGGVVGDAMAVTEAMRNDPGIPRDPQYDAINAEISAEVQRIGKQNSQQASAASRPVQIKNVVAIGPEQLAEEVLNTQAGEKLVVQHVGNNPNKIRGKWGS